MERSKLVEKLKGMTAEDRQTLRQALSESDPDTFLTGEEVSAIRELLTKGKEKTKKKSLFEEIFG